MASFPQQRQRRSPSRQQTTDEGFQQVRRQDSQAPSTTSVDSQTVLLGGGGSSSSFATSTEDSPQVASSAPRQEQARIPGGADAQDDVRRCWICFSDETDETSPRTWRSPCPCALTAHESCLLDWIADIERPNSGRTTAGHVEIRCPQCKSEILLSRPESAVLRYAGALERMASNAILPATLFGISYTLLLAFSHHGAHTIRRIFGDQDALAILRPRSPGEWNVLEREAVARFPDLALPFLREWRGLRVELGLPLIPAALVASRTHLGDAVLPFLPIAFFATQSYGGPGAAGGKVWPPSAALTLVTLPYIRSAYNEYLERVWGERERAWVKEIAPHFGDDGGSTSDGANRDDDGGVEEGEDVIDIRIGINLNDDDDDDDDEEEEEEEEEEDEGERFAHQPDERAQGGLGDVDRAVQAPDILADTGDQPPQDLADALEAAVDQAREQEREQEQDRRRPNQGRNFEAHLDLVKSLREVADIIVGALLFPSISAASGDLLRILLPKSWTALPAGTRWRAGVPAGLLQTKWGRSIVGGCLFVALKDAIRIYCRWRMAVSFRERRVRDYDKKRGVYL